MGNDTTTAERRAVSDAARIDTAVGHIRTSLTDVAALLPEPQGRPRTGTIGRHSPEGSEPWQGAAAAVYWDIHFGARNLEDVCRTAIGLPAHTPPRGGSTANTDEALRAISGTTTSLPPGMLAEVRRRVERWSTAIDQMPDVDRADTWVPVPRQPGALPPACPYCTMFTLRMSVRRELVRCFNPPCRDGNDRPAVARMDRNRITGDGVLVFGDGIVIHYREAAQTT
jgi:hypothetical protein